MTFSGDPIQPIGKSKTPEERGYDFVRSFAKELEPNDRYAVSVPADRSSLWNKTPARTPVGRLRAGQRKEKAGEMDLSAWFFSSNANSRSGEKASYWDPIPRRARKIDPEAF